MRIKRGTLKANKEGGRLYVLFDPEPTPDPTPDQSPSDSSALISEMRGRIEDLRDQLESERQAHAESRRLLMAALERIPPAIEAPQEPRESPVSPAPTESPTGRTGAGPQGAREATQRASETLRGPEPYPTTGGAEKGLQRPAQPRGRRSIWRRVFGG